MSIWPKPIPKPPATRTIVIYGPAGGQVILQYAGHEYLAIDQVTPGRYIFLEVPTMSGLNVFLTARGNRNVGIPGWNWYGVPINPAPPLAKNEWFTLQQAVLKPTWYQLPLIQPSVPAVPTRDQLLSVAMSFQGLTVQTAQYGALPWFEPYLASLNPADRQAVYAAKKAAGDTHINLAWSYAYREPGQPYNDIPGRDMTQDIAGLRALITEGLQAGFTGILLMLAGDGQGSGPSYNDPVGDTYGCDWLMTNLPRLITGLQQTPDLTPYVIFCPGYDGVFYGWSPLQVGALGHLFRSVLPQGHLAIEHNVGHIPCGEGGADYAPGGLMQTYDLILSEFDGDLHQNSTWQIVGRLVSPYHRPPDQPSHDDPNPPFYLAPGNPRGAYYYNAFEWALYDWVRSKISAQDVTTGRTYLQNMGARWTG